MRMNKVDPDIIKLHENSQVKILDQYLINESIQTLKKIKEGFQQSEENSILQMALTFEL